MKKLLLLLTSAMTVLSAQTLTLKPAEITNWKIKSTQAKTVDFVPLGSAIATVEVPPALVQAVSVPFEAQIKRLSVAPYSYVEENALLANVTGTQWIEAQKQAIADAIEFKHHKHTAERKAKLCAEEIIAQKECVAAEAELTADTIKLAASKALLMAYGASETKVNEIFSSFSINNDLALRSPFSGYVTQVNIKPGDRISASEAMFVLMKEGDLWLESDLNIRSTAQLHRDDTVKIDFNNITIETRVIQISPVINAINQTRHVRFSLKANKAFMPGMRSSATISLQKEALQIPKKALVKAKIGYLLFAHEGNRFTTHEVSVLGEDGHSYFIEPVSLKGSAIVTEGTAVLKGMLGDGADE